MNSRKIEEIVNDQRQIFLTKDRGMERDISLKKYFKTKQITVISGIRRSGKSTLLRQIASKLKDFYYINFDDERLIDFIVSDFNELMIVWQKKFISKNILIDEVQNIDHWERFLRRIHDEGYKIFITGSNAKLLSSELATHLTGRYSKIELYPFSFKEFLAFDKLAIGEMTSSLKSKILKFFDDYLQKGGFPEYLKYGEAEFVRRTYEDIIYKDIVARFGIREVKQFQQLTGFIFTNFTREANYNALSKILAIKSPMSVRKYIGFLEESFLIFELFKYDFSVKKQIRANKKIYVIDNGMRNNVAFSFSEDRGCLLENAVFIELKRRSYEGFYFQGKKECDFLVKEKSVITQAIQVTKMLDFNNEKREIGGLLEAMETFKLKEGLILTDNQEEERKIGKKSIKILPVWKWLLEN